LQIEFILENNFSKNLHNIIGTGGYLNRANAIFNIVTIVSVRSKLMGNKGERKKNLLKYKL
jgi:hypothetical protein